MTRQEPAGPLILLTGASGYVGGRLLKLLEQRGHRVRCLVRRPELLRGRTASSTEVVAGDVLDRESVEAALQGVDLAYYLILSMSFRPTRAYNGVTSPSQRLER